MYVNGAATAFEAYNIGGNNYFKLRDLAYALNGTAKQFEVGYDNATRAITLDTSKGYVPEGAATPTPTSTPTPIPTPTPSSSIDARLLGFWVRSIGTSDYRYYLSFKDDGSYSYVQISGSLTTTVTGRYSASGGRVYLTNLVDDMNRIIKDQSMSYSFGTDSDGEFLSIATVWFALAGTDEEPQEMSPTQFWRSQ